MTFSDPSRLARILKLSHYPQDVNRLVDLLHPRHAWSDRLYVLCVLNILLSLMFPFGLGLAAYTTTQLSAEQRRVLRAVIDSPQVWRIEANALAGFGLPFSRDELLSLLDRTAAP